MTAFDQLVRLAAVKARGTANDGDFAYLDIDDGGERTIRITVHHLVLPRLMAELDAVEIDVARARKTSNKVVGPPVAAAKKIDQASLVMARDIGSVVIRLGHPNGTTTNLALNPSMVDYLIGQLEEAKVRLKAPPRPF